ncbi:MAG: leucyl/phenylalanyl-tRNA--protein transferase [Alphaproteobacteria bacterium]|nr:leucyl/phenylalanyl-tRNA--protein transferase [Alphaproteobacteria bacterium]
MADITPELLLRAYALGMFPMAENADSDVIRWVEPKRRGILPLDGFHVPRSLRKTLRRGSFVITADREFAAVMRGCAEPAPGREDTWINAQILELYTALHAQGHAHSIEAWRDDRLVGGLYGVSIGAAFFGESMFSRATDASKVALVHLVARLRLGGYRLLDAQFITRHLVRFGAIEIARSRYMRLLADAIARRTVFYRELDPVLVEPALAGEAVDLQSTSHTS